MKDFLYFPSMTKGSLALLYFPGSNPRIATRHLMRWINGCPPLMEELSATGYHTSQKVFEPPGDTDQPASGQPRIALQALWNRMKAIKCHKVS